MKKNRNLYWSGIGLNSFGDGLQGIAIVLIIYTITDSPLAIGGLIAIKYIPGILLALWAGGFSDSKDSKRLVINIDYLRALITGIYAILIYLNFNSLILFYLLQFITSTADVIYKPALQTFLRESFKDEDYVGITSKAFSILFTANIAGIGLAGYFITAFSPFYCLVLNSITFIASAIFYMRVKRVQTRNLSLHNKLSLSPNMLEGWLFIKSTKGLLLILFLSMISSWGFQMTNTLLAPIAMDDLNGNASLFSVMEIAFASGAVIAGFLVKKILQKWGVTSILFTMIGISVFAITLGVSPFKTAVMTVLVFLGFFIQFHFIVMQTLLQINTPKDLMGRVVSVRTIVVSIAKISSALICGGLATIISPQLVYLFFGLTTIILLLLISRKFKHINLPKEFLENESAS